MAGIAAAWDGTPRLRTLFTNADTFNAEATALNEHAPLLIFLGAVMRTYEPGAKLDETVVLTGAKGIGKSAFAANLLPRSEWFTDSLDVGGYAKEMRESLTGAVVVELSEMQGLDRANRERLKAFMTRTVDRGRPAYGRYVVERPRRCVFIGTTNEENCLPADAHGLRRWLVVTARTTIVTRFNAVRYMAETRNLLWAEALQMYRDGAHPRVPDALLPALMATAEQHMSISETLDTALRDMLDSGKLGDQFKMMEVTKLLATEYPGVARHKASEKAIAAALQLLGCVKTHTRTGKLWLAPARPDPLF